MVISSCFYSFFSPSCFEEILTYPTAAPLLLQMNCLVSTPSCTHSAQKDSPEAIPFANHVHLPGPHSSQEL